jgi:hypothetical protein
VGVKGLVVSSNDGQAFGCKSEVSGRGEVCLIGRGISLVEVVIVEIWMRVGSCDEDACDKKSNGCD